MALSGLLAEPRPSSALPPITELLSRLREELVGSASEPERSSPIGRAERLFRTADPHWLFSSAPPPELRSAYVSLADALIGCAALPPCQDDCGGPDPAANRGVPGRAAQVSQALRALLDAVGNGERAGLLLAVAPPLCAFAVTHVQAWTSPSSRAEGRSLQEALLRAGGWRDSAHLLMGDEGQRQETGILGGVLDVLRPQLTKDALWRCAATKFVFAWTVLQVAGPALSAHLPRLLPPSLLLSDHYRPENCMLGVRCLHHIVLNTPAAELRQFNRAEVVYQALFKHLYTTEAAVIQRVLSCLLDLLLVLEKPPCLPDPSGRRRTSCRHDDVLRLLLATMEAESKVALRAAFAAALPAYIDRMGVAVCRHLRRLERVLLGYLEVRDPPEEANTLRLLEVLQKTTRAAWPRMAARVPALLPALLRLLADVSGDPGLAEALRRELMAQTVLCLRLLDGCSRGRLQTLLRQVDAGCCGPEVLGCLASVTMPTQG